MLVLTRKMGEEIIINDVIHVTVLEIRGGRVRLGITAPRETHVDRREVHELRVAQRVAAKPPPPQEVAV